MVTNGNLGYLKLFKSDMYLKFLKINFVVVVRHSARGLNLKSNAVPSARFLPDPNLADHLQLADNRNGDGAIHVSVDHRRAYRLCSIWRNRKSHAAIRSPSCVIFSVERGSESSRELSLSPNLAEQCMIALLRSFLRPFVLSLPVRSLARSLARM